MAKKNTGGRKRRIRARRLATNMHHQATSQQRTTSFTQEYQRWIRRRVAGFTLAGLGAVMIVVHVFMHLGNVQLVAMQDLLIGYPAGAVLIIIGAVIASRQPVR